MSPQGPDPGKRDPHQTTPTGKPRARAVGPTFRGTPGSHNAITDVPGVAAGHQTLIECDSVRTGVTAIHPIGKNNPGAPAAASYHSQNGKTGRLRQHDLRRRRLRAPGHLGPGQDRRQWLPFLR
jgi:hypothetical protein